MQTNIILNRDKVSKINKELFFSAENPNIFRDSIDPLTQKKLIRIKKELPKNGMQLKKLKNRNKPKLIPKPPKSRAKEYAGIGDSLVAKGKLNSAVYSYELAIRSEPQIIGYRLKLANTCKKLKRTAKACKAFLEILKIDRINKDALFGLADTYFAQGMRDLEDRWFPDTKKQNSNPVIHSDEEIGFVFDMARIAYGRAISAYPKARAKYYVRRGVCNIMTGNYEFARRNFLHAGKLNQNGEAEYNDYIRIAVSLTSEAERRIEAQKAGQEKKNLESTTV